jgi:hypothetical protein
VLDVLNSLIALDGSFPDTERDRLLVPLREWFKFHGFDLLPAGFSFASRPSIEAVDTVPAPCFSDEEKGTVLIASFGLADKGKTLMAPSYRISVGREPVGLSDFRKALEGWEEMSVTPKIMEMIDDWPNHLHDPDESFKHAVDIFKRFWELKPAKAHQSDAQKALDELLKYFKLKVYYPSRGDYFGEKWFKTKGGNSAGSSIARIRLPGLILEGEPDPPFNKAEVELN